jgi:hypothetical protein
MSNPELTGRPSALDRKATRLAQALTPSGPHRSASLRLARGLGWFSIGLGLVELLATRPLARGIGMRGMEPVLRLYGMREVGVGLGLLASTRPAGSSALMWGRVAGDALDIATLGVAMVATRPRGAHPLVALGAVAGVAALDLVCARALQTQADGERQTTDYSDRAGLPAPPEQMRGAALESFQQPADMRVSPPQQQLALT